MLIDEQKAHGTFWVKPYIIKKLGIPGQEMVSLPPCPTPDKISLGRD
jgi:hypothetical protein